MNAHIAGVSGNGVAPPPDVIQVSGIVKQFPGVKSLDDVSFGVRGGEIHALVGENGAGKSTLMKVLAGAYLPDEGALCFDGQPVAWKSSGPLISRKRWR